MRHILIIGNSAAGIAAAESLRERDKEARVTIVSDEPYASAYERFRLLGFLEGKVKERDLYFRTGDFYRNNRFELLSSREVAELNLNKKKAVFKDREFIEFDELVIATGRKVALPAVKGVQKEGVVAVNGLKDVKFILENLPIAHTVILIGSDPACLEIARMLGAKKVDLKVFGDFPEPPAGIEVVGDHAITEIIGESEARAVRLSNQKVLGASLVIVTAPRVPQVKFLEGTEVQVEDGILVDECGRTNIPFVYAAGDVCRIPGQEKIFGWESARHEGRVVGCQI
jgi:NAD(P)H-nitrite reductase large subunit